MSGLPRWVPKAQACWGILGDDLEHGSELSHLGTMKLGCLASCSLLSLSQGCSQEYELPGTFVCPTEFLSWKVTGVCSTMLLLAYNEMVTAHGICCVFGVREG